ncbi:unnamed protein product [Meloidogyne enterolobii]|uniref:Uncharacterized protein n=1 Tax=Meloidogyne enterolobii TaxID=390850 RepID=A0ACB0ZS62_MELEN
MIILPHINKGDFVWLDPTALGRNDSRQFILKSSEFPAIAARVLSVWTDQQGGEHIILLDDQSNKLELGATEFQRWAIRPMHPTSIQGVSDLIQMVELHEAALLRNFQIRHRQNIYHTFIGNRILVSLNNNLSEDIHLYTEDENQRKELIRSYRQRPPHELLPHIYAFGAEILRFVKKGKNNCCVVFSGETASGKSELFKQLLNFLSADFANQNFELKLNSAQIIIEAFTNAKTSRNINASRHGKYFELNYKLNNELSKIVLSSAKIELFFLEKYRVVEAFVEQSRESNFHIFYCLLAGLSPQQKLDFELTNGRISSYRLLAQYRRNSRENFINGETTSWMFGGERTRPTFELLSKVVGAFKILNFNEKEIESIWRLLAAILHLGNLRYNVKNYDGKENLELNDRLNIQRICKLLKIEKNLLISSLTIKSLCDLKSEKELNFRKLTIDEVI